MLDFANLSFLIGTLLVQDKIFAGAKKNKDRSENDPCL